jgi:hypothetical protein
VFPTYYELLAAAHELLRPRRYVEIGVHTGRSLALAGAEVEVIGVDPALPGSLEVVPGPLVRLVPTTSDEFFLDPALAGPIDLAFVDGLHLAEQALRDIANLEPLMAPDGVILVHDCVPIDAETATRERTTIVWSGDVWKVVPILRAARPDLALTVLDAAPTGVAVITGFRPGAAFAAEVDALTAPWLDRPWEDDRTLLDPQPATREHLAAAVTRSVGRAARPPRSGPRP